MKRCLVLVLFLFHALYADEDQDFSLVNLTKSPIPRIAGTVNIITGDWIDQGAHQETSGPDPYIVGHSYVSSGEEKGCLSDSWDFLHPSTLDVYQPKGIFYVYKSPDALLETGQEQLSPQTPFPLEKGSHRPSHHKKEKETGLRKPHKPHKGPKPMARPFTDPPRHNEAKLVYREAGGATFIFKGDGVARHFHPKIHKTGYNHIGSIEHPTRRDISRTTVKWDDHCDEWIVELGDGTKRRYARKEKAKEIGPADRTQLTLLSYRIKEEALPSGNLRWFVYGEDTTLDSIQTVSSDGKRVLHYVKFNWHKNSVKVTTSEGLSTKFSLNSCKDNHQDPAYIVEQIDKPGKGSLAFSYQNKNSHTIQRIKSKKLTNGRKDSISFYHDDKSNASKGFSKKEKKFLKNRVQKISTKQFAGSQSIRSHAFAYKEWSDHGESSVQDADGATSTYIWDSEFRPVWTGHETSDGQRLNSEHLIWGKDNDEGRLIRRTLLDEAKNPLLDREWEFDSDGNVVKESLRGLFTGRPSKPLSIDDHKHVHGGETLTWKAAYTSDGRHLKKSEIDPLGNWTFFEYDDSRALIKARLSCDQKKIIRREFFSYDEAAVCTKTISDDGSSHDRQNLTNVTRRIIHEVTPRRVLPFYGAPDEERWFIWTPEHEKQLLKIERYTRDSLGRTIAKELIDAAGVTQKRWTYAYDAFHRVIETCDPTGRVEQFSYDEAGRLSSKITPEATVSLKYDLLDRIIEEKKTFPDGTSESLCTQSCFTGRTTTSIDARGRTTTKVSDLIGRLVKTTFPAIATEQGAIRPESTVSHTGSTERHVSPSGAVTEIVRSATGKPLITTNPFGATTFRFYDYKNRLVEEQDPSGLNTLYEYDALDRPTRVEQQSNGQSLSIVTKRYVGFDLVEERTPTKMISYTYDSLGRKAEEKVTDLTTLQSFTTKTFYDSIHRPIRIQHTELETEELFTYDNADREIEHRTVGADGTLLSVTTHSYDSAGRVIEEGVGRAGTIAHTTTTYGAYGLPSSITYPDGTITKIAYNPLYRWSDGHTYFQKITTDARGVATEVLLDSNDDVRLSIVRDPYGTIISRKTASFSILGKPILVEDEAIAAGQTQSIVRTRLSYDSTGNLTSCTLADGTPDSATWHYRYDTQGRKIEEIKPSGACLSSSYDAKGRLAAFTSSDGTISWRYHYNVQDLPETIENLVSGRSTARRYNGLGTLLYETLENGLSLTYEVTSNNLLSSITYPDSSRSLYQYRHGRMCRIDRNGYSYEVHSRDLSGVITHATLPLSSGQIAHTIDVMGRRTSVHHLAFSEERTVFDSIGCCLERTIDGRREVFSYDFLCQLTSDNGKSSAYDSLHRRLETKGLRATHNARHQLLSQGKKSFQYDVDGRRTHDNRYAYSYDACDRLITIEDDNTKYEYTYDSFNRRMSSQILNKSTSIETQERYLWQGECEIGSVDSDSSMKTLRVLGEGLGGELGAAVAYELDGNIIIPIHDLSGHVRACINTHGDTVETLNYTAFGLESRSSDITPWTFSSKRHVNGTDFLYFGRRFYDPETATWLTQDPVGQSAGPNLYAYVKNNPLTCFDLYGLIDGSNESQGEYVMCERGVWRKDQVGQDNVPHLELTKNTWDEVIEKYAHGQFTVLGHTNGMLTTCETVRERQLDAIAKYHESYNDALAMYNPTHGLFEDFFETICSILGIPTDVVSELKGELMYVNDCMSEHGIQLVVDHNGHSEGAAINGNILSSDEFSGLGKYERSVGKIATYGGASIDILNAENYVVKWDVVPFLNPMNWDKFFSDKLHFIESGQTIFDAHSFDGPGYKNALDHQIHVGD